MQTFAADAPMRGPFDIDLQVGLTLYNPCLCQLASRPESLASNAGQPDLTLLLPLDAGYEKRRKNSIRYSCLPFRSHTADYEPKCQQPNEDAWATSNRSVFEARKP